MHSLAVHTYISQFTQIIHAEVFEANLISGEELGLPEVADIPEDQLQDPYYFRHGKENKGRDGCRVPLPWKKGGKNFGNGDGKPTHLPQPSWWGQYSVEAEENDPSSTLGFYRQAIRLRQKLQCAESIEWVDYGEDILAFKRPNGWMTVVNFGKNNFQLPPGEILMSSDVDLQSRELPSEATVWMTT